WQRVKELVQDLGAAEVVLDREQELRVSGDLGQRRLGHVVELGVVCELEQERAKAAGLAECGHPQDEVTRDVVLGDRFERFEVLVPAGEHRQGVNASLPPRDTAGASRASASPASSVPSVSSPRSSSASTSSESSSSRSRFETVGFALPTRSASSPSESANSSSSSA